MRSKPRGAMRDNSKSIFVRMAEEQYQRLRRYMALTRLPVTTYFRKLIHGDGIRENAGFPQSFRTSEIDAVKAGLGVDGYGKLLGSPLETLGGSAGADGIREGEDCGGGGGGFAERFPHAAVL